MKKYPNGKKEGHMNDNKNCHVEPLEKPVNREALSKAEVAYLAVLGMGCPSCATRIRNGLFRLYGVLWAEIDLKREVAVVAYNPGQVSQEDMVTAVVKAGDGRRHQYQAQFLKQIPTAQVLR